MITEIELAERLDKGEYTFFYERTTGDASGTGYISSSTWRAWSSVPKVGGWVRQRLVGAFEHPLCQRLASLLEKYPRLDRARFDAFHDTVVQELYDLLSSTQDGPAVYPRSQGDFNGYAYNAYAKVVDLAYTHWCFRPNPANGRKRCAPSECPELRHVLHVPLDSKILLGLRTLCDEAGLRTNFPIPRGGMGSIRSRDEYYTLQSYIRQISNGIQSTNYPGHSVSPLAFEAFWGR